MTSGFAPIPVWLLKREDVSGPAKLVYAALAAFVDEDAQAFPAQKTLAAMAGCSVSRVKEALSELRALGVLSWAPRTGVNGGQTSNLYHLDVHPTRSSTPQPCAGYPQPCAGYPQPVSGYELDPTELKNPPTSPEGDKPEPLIEPPTESSDDFDTFWAAYPRKAGKVAARKAFRRAVSRDGTLVILAGVDRFAHDPNLPELQFVPHAATWLARGSYGDDPLPERAESKPAATAPGAEDEWMYLGSGQPRKTYADFADPDAPRA